MLPNFMANVTVWNLELGWSRVSTEKINARVLQLLHLPACRTRYLPVTYLHSSLPKYAESNWWMTIVYCGVYTAVTVTTNQGRCLMAHQHNMVHSVPSRISWKILDKYLHCVTSADVPCVGKATQKRSEQCLHEYGFAPVWIRTWHFRFSCGNDMILCNDSWFCSWFTYAELQLAESSLKQVRMHQTQQPMSWVSCYSYEWYDPVIPSVMSADLAVNSRGLQCQCQNV